MTEESMKNVMERALGIARGWCGGGEAGGEDCVVSHPDAGGPCGRPGTGMVWNLSFCEVHGAEAEAAALAELTEDAEIEMQALRGAENGRPGSNLVSLRALEEAGTLNSAARSGCEKDHQKALYLAYPLIEGRADPTVTTFDYDSEYSGDGPVEWWADTRYLLCRFMREAQGEGLPELVRELEPLRERASAQLVQAEADYERRWITPQRRAAKLRAAAER